MTSIDLEPATSRMAGLVRALEEPHLDLPTPCPAYTVGDLVEHIGGFAMAFQAAAAKDLGGLTSHAPSGDATRLTDDWRTRIPADLERLAVAWRDPQAWTGMTQAGGVDLPGEAAGIVVLDELVVHGWDLARATGQAYDPEEHLLHAVRGFAEAVQGPQREGLFGPPVTVAPGVPLLDQVIGLTGRDPAWSPQTSAG
ncbi:MAG: TIGR03086 family metal-binding protein [Acidimicrobiales bacterium]